MCVAGCLCKVVPCQKGALRQFPNLVRMKEKRLREDSRRGSKPAWPQPSKAQEGGVSCPQSGELDVVPTQALVVLLQGSHTGHSDALSAAAQSGAPSWGGLCPWGERA